MRPNDDCYWNDEEEMRKPQQWILVVWESASVCSLFLSPSLSLSLSLALCLFYHCHGNVYTLCLHIYYHSLRFHPSYLGPLE